MKFKKRHYLIITFCILLAGNVKSQQVIFSEGFENHEMKSVTVSENKDADATPTHKTDDFADILSVTGVNKTYKTPALDLSNGVSFIKFNLKQKVSDTVSGGLKVYYKTENEDQWLLLASFDLSSEDWSSATLFLPENPAPVSIMFSAAAMGMNTIYLDDVQVLKYKFATAYTVNNKVYVDTLNNLSSTLLKINVSENQKSGLPSVINNAVKTPGIPVSCPAGAMLEGEPDCYTDYVDAYNGGCNSDPDAFSTLTGCNGTICGKSGSFTLGGVDNRDLDQFSLQIAGPTNATLKVVADFPVRIFILSIPYGCDGPTFNSAAVNANPGDTASIINYNIFLASNVVFWVAPQAVTGVTCGSNYVLTYKTAAITNPATPVANPACAPTQLTPMSPQANYTYYWQGTSCGISTTNSALVAYTVPASGTYYVRGIYTPLGCWTPCSSINIGTATTPTFTPIAPINSGDYLASLPTTSTNGIIGTWAPALNNTATTTYTFTPNTGQCACTTTLTITVITYTSVSENFAAVNLVVYPNPTSKRLYVNFDGMKAIPKSMKLFNALGQVCFETNVPLQSNAEGINVANLNPGTYNLQIVFENGTINKPVIVN